jgi:hypothetical protein
MPASALERTGVSVADVESHAAAVRPSRVYEVVDEARRRALLWSNLAARGEARAKRKTSATGRTGPLPVAVASRSTGSSIDRRYRPRPYRDLTSAASLDR